MNGSLGERRFGVILLAKYIACGACISEFPMLFNAYGILISGVFIAWNTLGSIMG
jgi:hypothetical protein